VSEAAYHQLLGRALVDRSLEAEAVAAYKAGAPRASWSWSCRCGAPFDPVEGAKWRGDSWHWRHALAGRWRTCGECSRTFAVVGGGRLGEPGLLELPQGGTRAYRGHGSTPLIECTYAESVALSALEELRATYDHKLQDLEEASATLRKLEAAGVDAEVLAPLRARALEGVELLEAQRALKAKVRKQKREVLARIVGARQAPDGRRLHVDRFDQLEWWRDRELVDGARGEVWRHGLVYVAISPLPRRGEHVELSGYTPLRYAGEEPLEPAVELDVAELFPSVAELIKGRGADAERSPVFQE